MNEIKQLAREGKINDQASIRDRQSIIINASIEKVWDLLIQIDKWDQWNPMISRMKNNGVTEGSTFTWNLNKSHVISEISVNKPLSNFNYTSSFSGSKTIQIWNLEKSSPKQTIVTTEVSMQGFRSLFYSHQTLNNNLILWLEILKKTAEG